MNEFLLGVAGILIGAMTTAALGYVYFQRQKRHENRLQLIQETCQGLVKLSRIASGHANGHALEETLLLLQANLALSSVLFDKDVAKAFEEAVLEVAGPKLSTQHADSVERLLVLMTRRMGSGWR